MKMRLLAVLLILASASDCQEIRETQLTGTAINTTNADKPVAAPIQILVGHGGCKLIVSVPLIGSGSCRINSYDTKSGYIKIVSFGSPMIVWTGTVKGNFASGTYKIDVGAQTGSFYLAILQTEKPLPTPAPTPNLPLAVPHRSSCVPAVESAINGEIEGWDGETIFKLENGQIWQQAEYDYTYFYEYNPDVTIYETSAGCRMKVEDEDETVLVKRIK
jgi:hypothetical protein